MGTAQVNSDTAPLLGTAQETAVRETAVRETAARETAAPETAARETAVRETAVRAGAGEPVAIVGIGCRLPGGIETPAALWQGLRDATVHRGGLLDDITGFDADLFRVPPAEARRMDPRRRIALETAWAALEDARIVHDGPTGSRTGVFLGTTEQGYDGAALPARIARTLGLRGPAPAVPAAGGSSLTAVHLAVRALREGAADLALAGGVDVRRGPRSTLKAEGVRGEGCGIVVLRRLSDALTAGDRVYAVVRGSAVVGSGPHPAGPAAGVVGLLSTALALHHGELPAGEGELGGARTGLVLAEAPYRRRLFVPLAADSAEGLRAAADMLADRIRTGDTWYVPELLGRATGSHRVVAAVAHRGELADALRTHIAARAQDPGRPDALAFCFGGPDTHRLDASRDLLGASRDLLGEPAFRAALDECDRALRPYTGRLVTGRLVTRRSVIPRSVTGELLADRAASGPELFALQTAIARTLSAWGVEPAVVLGEGTGEVAAAVFAGVLPLADAARLITTWSRLVAERADAGSREVDAGAGELAPELERRLGTLRTRLATVPFWSAVTGGYTDGSDLDAAYWARALCAPAPRAEAPRALPGGRALRVLAITPHPGGARQALEDVAAALWCDGFDVDWGAVTGRRRRGGPAPVALTVSGRTARARAENAGRLARHLDGTPDAGLLDVAYTAARHRPHLEYRASVVAASSAEAAEALRALAAGHGHPGLVAGTPDMRAPDMKVPDMRAPDRGTDLAVLFPGEGSRRIGMGRELYAAFPRFRWAFDEVCAALDPHLPLPLVAVLFGAADGPDAVLVQETRFAQPALFAVEVASYRLWESWGVVPAAVAGHAVGEVAAAHVAGVLDLADAARLAAARGRLAQADARPGEFGRVAAQCVFRAPSMTWVSTVTGRAVSADEAADPGYWVRQVRDPVRFVDAIATWERSGAGRYLECGPAGEWDEVRALTRELGVLHVAGQDIDWERVFAGGVPVDLPSYAFQRTSSGAPEPPVKMWGRF
ncbi:acyltransferase domain-containing protein [Streptomyces sp. NPDC048442]|uniref:acyltransferase domain-containing protein n=1 Tax=Streptomyces sp. NPDC048442 TaxID=3154823 RepID=UPI00343069E7